MKKVALGFLGFALVLTCAGTMEAALPHYVMTVLGDGSPLAINNYGQVVGNDTNQMPVIWQNGTATELNVTADAASGAAFGINNSGQIAGCYQSSTDYLSHVAYWSSPGAAIEPVPGEVDYNLQPYSINNSGQMVGLGTGQFAFTWQDGQSAQQLGGSFASSVATSINDSGQIVGYAADSNWNWSTVLWSPSDGYTNPTAIGGWYPYAMNNNGQIVGSDPNTGNAVLWQNGNLQVMAGVFTPNSINNSGVVAGQGWFNGGQAALVWESDTGLVDLSTLIYNLGGAVLPGRNCHQRQRADHRVLHRLIE